MYMNKVVIAKMEVMHRLNKMDFRSPKAYFTVAAALCQMYQQPRPTLNSKYGNYGNIPWNEQSVTWWQLDCAGQLPLWTWQYFALTGVDIFSGYRFVYPACNILAKTTICGWTKGLIHHHDIPYSIASEQETHFTARGGWQGSHGLWIDYSHHVSHHPKISPCNKEMAWPFGIKVTEQTG